MKAHLEVTLISYPSEKERRLEEMSFYVHVGQCFSLYQVRARQQWLLVTISRMVAAGKINRYKLNIAVTVETETRHCCICLYAFTVQQLHYWYFI